MFPKHEQQLSNTVSNPNEHVQTGTPMTTSMSGASQPFFSFEVLKVVEVLKGCSRGEGGSGKLGYKIAARSI